MLPHQVKQEKPTEFQSTVSPVNQQTNFSLIRNFTFYFLRGKVKKYIYLIARYRGLYHNTYERGTPRSA